MTAKTEKPETGTAMTGPVSSGPPEPGSFGDGYQEGREDVFYALAAGHPWAVAELEKRKAKNKEKAP